MQYKNVTMQGQYTALADLVKVLQLKYELARADDTTPMVCSERVAQHLRSASFYSLNLYEGLEENMRVLLVEGVKDAIVTLIDGVVRIKIEVGEELGDVTPEKPQDVMACDDLLFHNLIEKHKSRLTAAFGATACNNIWKQRQKMIQWYGEDSSFRRRVDGVAQVEFEEAWTTVDCERTYAQLFAFIAGLAVISPGTHTVESEFSLLKQIKNPQRSALSNTSP